MLATFQSDSNTSIHICLIAVTKLALIRSGPPLRLEEVFDCYKHAGGRRHPVNPSHHMIPTYSSQERKYRNINFLS